MPRKPRKPCSYPGCPGLTETRYCEKHRDLEPPKHHEGSESNPFYATSAWKRKRREFLEEHPSCAMCGRPAVIVDHIIPIRQGGGELDDGNLQALCQSCHSAKSILDGSRYRRRVYAYPHPLRGSKIL